MSSRVFTFIRRSLAPLRFKSNVTSKRKYDTNPNPEEHVTNWGDHFFFDTTNHRLLAIKFMFFFGIPYWLPFIMVVYQITKGNEKGGKQKSEVEDVGKAAKGKKAKASA